MKAYNILWDVDDKEELKFLPKTIKIPNDVAYDEDGEVDEDAISDFLSDETGYCHCGFSLK